LDAGIGPEGALHGGVQPLGTVDEDQEAGMMIQAAIDPLAEELAAGALILGGGLYEAQGDLPPVQGDTQGLYTEGDIIQEDFNLSRSVP
jgi:hypothetical protein